jgi:folate-dependent phosphoribosylglycinamide formyltransferase PurN
MNVVLLVPRIHLHAPYVLRALAPRARSGEDSYLVVTTPKLPGRRQGLLTKVASLLLSSGPVYAAAMARDRARQVVRGGLEALLRVPPARRQCLTVPQACRLLGAEALAVRSVREPALLERVREFRPDLLCAVFFNQFVPGELRDAARLAAVNIHPSYLPQYRGVSPCFWVLARGETATGVTIHGMTDELDRGPLLARARVEIDPRDTLHSLYRRCALAAGDLLAEVLGDPERLSTPDGPPEGEGSYFAAITAGAVHQFRGRGRRFS